MGLAQGARVLRNQLSARQVRRLQHIDVCFNVMRHVTAAFASDFVYEVRQSLKAEPGQRKADQLEQVGNQDDTLAMRAMFSQSDARICALRKDFEEMAGMGYDVGEAASRDAELVSTLEKCRNEVAGFSSQMDPSRIMDCLCKVDALCYELAGPYLEASRVRKEQADEGGGGVQSVGRRVRVMPPRDLGADISRTQKLMAPKSHRPRSRSSKPRKDRGSGNTPLRRSQDGRYRPT
eukprot:UN1010